MPREHKELVRPGGIKDAEKFFLLSFEGEKSEPKYFKDFRDSEYFNNSGLIEIIPLRKTKNSGTNPIYVKRLLKEVKNDYNFKKTDEFWLIIDRDQWESIHKISFEDLYNDCRKESNFFIALSNPCFEIWLLLHLKDINEFDDKEQKKIYENSKTSSSKNYIDQVLGEISGRGYNKRPNPNVFLPNIKNAIERAKKLDDRNDEYPSYLGSHVYKLVEKLIK